MKIILIILSVCCFKEISAQWEILNYAENSMVQDIDFVNENVGWIAGMHGLLKTEDGGDTWIALSMDIKEGLIYDVDFINENVGWCIPGLDGIFKSVDGGQTWTRQRIEWGGSYIIYAVDSNVVYASRWNKILKTSDSGENWIEVYYKEDDNFFSMQFLNQDTGILAGYEHTTNTNYYSGFILQTFDGGNSWNRITDSKVTRFDNLQFINDSTGYFIAIDENGSNLCFTSDACNSWTIRTDSKVWTESFYLLENDNVFGAFSDIGGDHYIMQSTDGGFTWERKDILSGWVNYEMYFYSTELGFININIGGGWGGYIGELLYKTIDSGNNWTMHEFAYPLYDVNFFDRDFGFVAGGVSEWHGGIGDVFKTVDGGKSWINAFHSSNQVKSICFINTDLGFILTNQTQSGSFTKIHKTKDSGLSWSEVYTDDGDSSGFFFSGNEINFLNENIGWVSGSASDYDSTGAAFLHTDNGGSSWDVKWVKSNIGYYNYKISSSFFLNPNLGWAVGEGGLIVKYSSDQWEVQNNVTDLPLKDVYFSDEKHGWISGGYLNEHDFQSIILSTVDGGITWNSKTIDDYLINDVFFKDNLTGFAVGHDTVSNNKIGMGMWQPEFKRGAILKTNDGGKNWFIQISELSASLTAIHFSGGYGWAVGETGLVLRTGDGITWIDENTGELYPPTYYLTHNYPNPFNPSTTIGYTIPTLVNSESLPAGRQGAKVNLVVYDVLGREVESLVNEKQKPGNYEVEFSAKGGSGSDGDGNQLTSGIYFYRLRAGDFVEINKIILLK